MEKICGIYKIISPSGKIYIGQSVDINRRIKSYKYGNCKEQPYLYNSILKYGWCSFDFFILEVCNENELNDKEKYYIDKYNTFNTKHGMNLRDGGGSHGKMSIITKEKMKQNHKDQSGEKNPNFNKKWIYRNDITIIIPKDELNKYLIDGWCLGNLHVKNNTNKKGKKLSSVTKEKISKNHAHHKPNLGKKHSEETKMLISESNKGRVAVNKKPIIDISTNIIYPSKKEAADALGIKVRTLKAKLLGKIKNNTNLRYYTPLD